MEWKYRELRIISHIIAECPPSLLYTCDSYLDLSLSVGISSLVRQMANGMPNNDVPQRPKTCRLLSVAFFYLIMFYTASTANYILQNQNILFLTDAILI